MYEAYKSFFIAYSRTGRIQYITDAAVFLAMIQASKGRNTSASVVYWIRLAPDGYIKKKLLYRTPGCQPPSIWMVVLTACLDVVLARVRVSHILYRV